MGKFSVESTNIRRALRKANLIKGFLCLALQDFIGILCDILV